jgi:uncharacterized protein
MSPGQYYLFSRGGLNILVDVPSGAVHLLDNLAADLVPYFAQDKSLGEAARALDLTQENAQQAWSELASLRARGQFLFPEPVFSARPGGGKLKALCLHVSHDCELRCRYCFAGTGPFGGKRELMPLAVAKEAVDMLFASGAGAYEIDFFGGEPLLNLDVVEATSHYARERAAALGCQVNLTLTTNCYSLDETVRKRVQELGLALVLSHDGRPEIHDAMRPLPGNHKSYQRITDNLLAAAQAASENHYVRGTYTALNTDFVADIRHWLDLGLKRFSMEPVVAPASSKLALKEEHLEELREQYWQLVDLALSRNNGFTFFHFLLDWNQGLCGAKRSAGCGAGQEYLAVAPNGDLYPCHQFMGQQEWLLGNVSKGISQGDLSQIIVNSSLAHKPQCQICWARYHCGGGCHANAWWANQDLHSPWQLGCELLKIRTEAAIYLKVKHILSTSEGDCNG